MSAVLGGMAARQFLAEYWQREPLVVRGACPDLGAAISPEELAGLALEPEVESRLLRNNGGPAEEGPFDTATFLALPESDWTLLVQAVDLWVPEVAAVLDLFDFLPRWRIDDVMVSYATPGGGVGAHVDRYDVFLIQAQGRRRWRIDGDKEWLLESGDLLYLPPGVQHDGVAAEASMTFSVGFRAPAAVEMLDDLATELMSQGLMSGYVDPPLTPAMATEEIDPKFVSQVRALLQEVLQDNALLGDWFARYMTAPKYAEHVDVTGEARRARFGDQTYVNGDVDQ